MNFNEYKDEIIKILNDIDIDDLEKKISIVSDLIVNGKKVLLCGNGGSAADSQHLATELVVRFEKERKPLKAVSLTTDTSLLTAISNDYTYEEVFARQVEMIGEKGDILICFSTSGNSKNIIKAAEKGKEKNLFVVGFLGRDGGKLIELCDLYFLIQKSKTSHIQELHEIIFHYLCKKIEEKL